MPLLKRRLKIWDSLAIAEYLGECLPKTNCGLTTPSKERCAQLCCRVIPFSLCVFACSTQHGLTIEVRGSSSFFANDCGYRAYFGNVEDRYGEKQVGLIFLVTSRLPMPFCTGGISFHFLWGENQNHKPF